MIITDFLATLRDGLDDSKTPPKFSDAELVRHTDQQSLGMVRQLSLSSREWHNFSLCLQKESAKQLFRGTFQWRVPTWIERVVAVYERRNNATAETTASPYLWTAPELTELGDEIKKADSRNTRGWSWEGQHTFRMWGETSAREIVLQVVKIPPPMFKAKVATAHASTTFDGIYLPAIPTLGTYALEEGAYINAEVQCTASDDVDTANVGEVRRVIYSRANAIVASTRQKELRLETGLPEAIQAECDWFETLIAIPEIHARYLALRVINACAIKKNNVDLQRSLAPELAQEARDFVAYATSPRDTNGPYFKTSGSNARRRYDANQFMGSWPW